MRMIAIKRARAEHEQPKAEILHFKPTRIRANQQSVQIAVSIAVTQIGIRRVELTVVFAPDQIVSARSVGNARCRSVPVP